MGKSFEGLQALVFLLPSLGHSEVRGGEDTEGKISSPSVLAPAELQALASLGLCTWAILAMGRKQGMGLPFS